MIRDQRVVSVNGVETAVLEAGPSDAPTVLLLHDGAWGGSAPISWSGVLPALAQTYRVVAPDMLGFGGTSKLVHLDSSPYEFRIRHLVSLLDTLGIPGPVHVVGTSFGGSVGLNMLASHADRVASLVSISGTGGPWRTSFGIELLGSWDGTRESLMTIVSALAEDTAEFSAGEHLKARLASASIPGHYRSMMAPGVPVPEQLKRTNAAAAEWPRQITGVTTPVLLVQGLRDQLVDADWTSHLAAVLPNAEVVQLDSLHSPNLSTPAHTAELLLDWLERAATRVVQHA